MGFQENLRYYRERAGYKQSKDFAQALDIPYSTYKGYETQGREPKYNTLCKIADLLNVSTDELLGRENNILGVNENDKIRKELSDVMTSMKNEQCPFDLKFKIIDNVVGLYFKDKNSRFGMCLSKKELTKMINNYTAECDKVKKFYIYSDIIFNLIDVNQEQLKIEFQNEKNDTEKLNILKERLKLTVLRTVILGFATSMYSRISAFDKQYTIGKLVHGDMSSQELENMQEIIKVLNQVKLKQQEDK